MKAFYVPKDPYIKIVLLLAFVLFLIIFAVTRDFTSIMLIIIVAVGYIIAYCQRDINVEAEDEILRIRKFNSRILREESIEIPYGEIARIQKDVGSKSRHFNIIVLRNGRKISLPKDINKELDIFIEELDDKLKAENEEYASYNNKLDTQNDTARAMLIGLIILFMIAETSGILLIRNTNHLLIFFLTSIITMIIAFILIANKLK